MLEDELPELGPRGVGDVGANAPHNHPHERLPDGRLGLHAVGLKAALRVEQREEQVAHFLRQLVVRGGHAFRT